MAGDLSCEDKHLQENSTRDQLSFPESQKILVSQGSPKNKEFHINKISNINVFDINVKLVTHQQIYPSTSTNKDGESQKHLQGKQGDNALQHCSWK